MVYVKVLPARTGSGSAFFVMPSSGRGRSISRELESKGIIVKSSGRETLAEEMPEAYKDINEVVGVVEGAGISKRVCRMKPLGVIKG